MLLLACVQAHLPGLGIACMAGMDGEGKKKKLVSVREAFLLFSQYCGGRF